MKLKVSWTQRELNLLAAWFRDNGIDPTARGFSNALREAQANLLPSDRHRSTVGMTSKTRLDIALAIKNLPAELPKPRPAIVTPAPPSAEGLSTEELLVELARRIARLLEQKPVVEAALAKDVHPKHDPSPQSEVRQRKQRILVCGPNIDLMHDLERRFPNLDLRFVGFQDNPARAVEKAKTCDLALLLTKFINHSTADAVKNSGVTYSQVTGAREAREWLSTL